MKFHYLLLYILSTNLSHAACDDKPAKLIPRSVCEPLASTLCCSFVSCVLSSSTAVALPTSSQTLQYYPGDLLGVIGLATCLAPYGGHFVTSDADCDDPVELFCPGVRSGRYAPTLGLCCKGPLAAAAFFANIALAERCPALASAYEILPRFLCSDKGSSIACLGLEMLTCAFCLGHHGADLCTDCLSQSSSEKTSHKNN